MGGEQLLELLKGRSRPSHVPDLCGIARRSPTGCSPIKDVEFANLKAEMVRESSTVTRLETRLGSVVASMTAVLTQERTAHTKHARSLREIQERRHVLTIACRCV